MALTVQESRTHDCIQDACKEYVKNSRKIDWEQRRYEVARDLFSNLLAQDPNVSGIECARNAVVLADYLIEELKK